MSNVDQTVAFLRDEVRRYEHTRLRCWDYAADRTAGPYGFADLLRAAHAIVTGDLAPRAESVLSVHHVALAYLWLCPVSNIIDDLATIEDPALLVSLQIVDTWGAFTSATWSNTTSADLARLNRHQYNALVQPTLATSPNAFATSCTRTGRPTHQQFLTELLEVEPFTSEQHWTRDLALLLIEDHEGTYRELIEVAELLTNPTRV